jgi:Secretion system C-terminal sorting domain/SprB repeat
MKLFKIIILFLASYYITSSTYAQANPSIGVLPANSGLVSLGGTLDLQVTIGNTGVANIVAFKLRPVITVPAILNLLPDAQQTGLPVGWSIVSNTGSQIRICNGTDVIAGSTSRTIIIKVQGVSIGGPSTFSGQINYGGASCAVAGPAPAGNNTADDFATSTVQVVAGCNLGVSTSAGTILCNGGTTTITAAATNAVGAIEYSLTRTTGSSVFQSSNIFNNELAGTYTVTAREVANPSTCVAVSSIITIDDPAAIAAPTVSIVQPTCSVATGAVSITSATTGLTFSIDGNTSYINYTTAIPLATGPHTIRAKNSNNCLSPITSFTIDAQPPTPASPLVGAITQPNCSVSTGTVVLNGMPSGDWIINPGAIAGNTTSTTINSLAAGTYNFTVTNALGCTSFASGNVVINAVVGAPITPTTLVIQPTCTVSTGSITITSATTGLTFSLDGGSYATYPATGFVGIVPGNHTIIAQNVSGCLSPLANFTINAQPLSPTAAILNVLQPTCTIATGTITVTSPTAGLTFSFNNGTFGPYPSTGYTASPGIYTIAVQNTSGCAPAITNNIIVNPQPTSPSVLISATPITCFGSSTILTANGSGGILPYQYSLNAGAFQLGNTFPTNAGTYSVVIKDANGCTGSSNSLIITQPTQIAASISANAIACSGGNTTLTVVATGGTGAYEYSLNNGTTYQSSNIFSVVAGTYTAKVRLIANQTCTANTSNFTVLQPDSLKASSSALAINKCGGTTEVKVVGVGGKLPYSGTGNFVKGPGNWSFLVTDANGCTATTKVTILPPGCVDISVFPNPAQNIITINHAKAELESTMQIFAMNGALVISKSVPQNTFKTTIDVSRLASATYVLVYVSGKERKEIKFIKTNTK